MEEKKEVTIQEIQSKLLEILLYFQKFCQENGLGSCWPAAPVWVPCATKGFIPWDDDVDVFMLRDDYEKLCRIWDEKADTEHYSCVRSNDRFNIRHSATEIKDNNTTFINRHSADLDIHQGLMIDVIPLDAVPKSKWKQLWQMVDSMMYCCFNFQRLPAHKGKVTYYAEKLALTLVPSFKAPVQAVEGRRKATEPLLAGGCGVRLLLRRGRYHHAPEVPHPVVPPPGVSGVRGPSDAGAGGL